MTEAILINEVGPRDGLQSQHANITLAGKAALIEALAACGIKAIEAGSFVSPKAIPQMADTAALWPLLPDIDRIQYSALVPNLRGLERAQAAGVREIAVVLSATDTMNLRNIRMDLSQTVAACTEVIQAARQARIRCKAYIAVAFECPFEGIVAPGKVLQLSESMVAAGAHEIVIADTIGAACPSQVKPLLSGCVERFGSDRVSAHFHDTRSFALANVWASIEAGVRRFDASLGGLGGCPFAPGAAGNVATEDVVLMAEQCGFRTGIDVAALRSAIDLAGQLVGHPLGGRTSRWLQSRDSQART